MKIKSKTSIFTIKQEKKLRSLKGWVPHRFVWGAVNIRTRKFEAHADHDKQLMRKYVRTKQWRCAAI